MAKKDKDDSASAKRRPKEEVEEDVRGIIRIAGKDVRGFVPLNKALYHVRGVGRRYAAICAGIISKELGVDTEIPVGKLSDDQLGIIEGIIINPAKHNIPSFLTNRRRDFSSGEDKHLISNELDFAVKMDIEKEKKLRTWRGISHMYRKKVRGQKTRTGGRRASSVGVVRKKLQPAKGAPKKGR